MFCLRSWLPLLFIPTTASPSFILLFFLCTYFLNRPCIYCSFLLVILFVTSCNWSDRCFFDFGGNWFEPRHTFSSTTSATSISGYGNSTASGIVGGLVEESLAVTMAGFARDIANTTTNALLAKAAEQAARARAEWTGLGLGWVRSLLEKSSWRIECLDVTIRL